LKPCTFFFKRSIWMRNAQICYRLVFFWYAHLFKDIFLQIFLPGRLPGETRHSREWTPRYYAHMALKVQNFVLEARSKLVFNCRPKSRRTYCTTLHFSKVPKICIKCSTSIK
jgi:hypothetical protein